MTRIIEKELDGWQGSPGTLDPEDRARIDAAIAAAEALDGATLQVVAAVAEAQGHAGVAADALAQVDKQANQVAAQAKEVAAARAEVDSAADAARSAAEAATADARLAADAASAAGQARDQITGMQVRAGDALAWDAAAKTLTVPLPKDGNDGTSVTIRTATPAGAAALSAQYPGDLIVVPQ